MTGIRSASRNISIGNAMSPSPEPAATSAVATTSADAAAMSQVASRRRRIAVRGFIAAWAACVISILTIAVVDGGDAAALPRAAPPDAVSDLAGRWSGKAAGWSVCDAASCAVVLDIVACGNDWCGIRVEDASGCGAIILRLTATSGGDPVTPEFKGRINVAKGSADFIVDAVAFNQPHPRKRLLNLTGSTTPELLMMRRSYPLRTQLERIAEPVCTLEKTTS